MRRTLLAALVLVAVATGCIKYETTIDVADDGSGTIDILVAVDASAFADMGSMFEDLGGEDLSDLGDFGGGFGRDELCAEFRADMGDDMPSGVRIEDYDDGSFCGLRMRADFGPGDDVVETLSAIFGAADSPTDDLVLRQEPDGGWRFETSTSLGMGEDFGDLGDLGGTDLPPGMADQFIGGASITFDVRLPGRPVDHNADRVDGNRFHWDLALTDSRSRLFAVTEPGTPIPGTSDDGSSDDGSDDPDAATGGPAVDGAVGAPGSDDGGSSALWWILGIVAAVVVLGGLAFLVMRNRSTPTPAPAGSPMAPGDSPWGAPGVGAPHAGDPAVGADASAAPGGGAAPSAPTWDEQRQAWIQYNAGQGQWLTYDEASQQWRPLT